MKEKGTFTTSEGTGRYNNKPLNQFKITMKTAVEWLQEQYNQCPKYEEQIYEQDWEQAKAIEKEKQSKLWTNEEVFDMLYKTDKFLMIELREYWKTIKK
jgi:hypothetical protein